MDALTTNRREPDTARLEELQSGQGATGAKALGSVSLHTLRKRLLTSTGLRDA